MIHLASDPGVNRDAERVQHAPRDKPQVDRVEHANIERPGAQAHPMALSWPRPHERACWPTKGFISPQDAARNSLLFDAAARIVD